jgi:tetratricopeptide (TPR) repeat protein
MKKPLAIGVLLILGVAVALVWRNRLRSTPPPPEIDLTPADSRVAQAIKDARRQVLESPRSAAAWGKLGMVLVAHDFPAEGNECLAQAEKLDPQESRWPYLQGVTLVQGDPPAALEKFQRAVVLRPDFPPLRLRLGETLFEQGQIDEAETQFHQVLEQNPNDPRVHMDLGRVAFSREDWPGALDHFQRAESRFPNLVHPLLAQVYLRLGNTAAANKEVPLINDDEEPDLPDPYVDEVDHLRVGPQALIGLAEQLRRQGRGKEAIAVLDKLIQEEPGAARSWEKMGKALVYLGRNAAAEKALQQAIHLAPGSFESHFLLGVALYRQKNRRPQSLEAAIDSFRQAIRLNPGDARCHYTLGLCGEDQGDQEKAIAAFRQALRYKPDYADAHLHLGQLLAQQNKTAEAITHLEDAVRLAPGNSEAKKVLEQLRKAK